MFLLQTDHDATSCDAQIFFVLFIMLKKNRDDNTHKREALKWYYKRTLTLVNVRTESAEYICISLNKIVSKFVAKLLKYMLKDILIFLGLDYRDASLITSYLVVIGISIPKIRLIG